MEPQPHQTLKNIESELEHWNHYFNLQPLQDNSNIFTTLTIQRPTITKLKLLKVLRRVPLPFSLKIELFSTREIVDNNIELRELCTRYPTNNKSVLRQNKLHKLIVVHIRQGLLLGPKFSSRLIKLEAYEKALADIIHSNLDLIEYDIQVITETKKAILIPEVNYGDIHTYSQKSDPKYHPNLPDPTLHPILHKAHWWTDRTAFQDFTLMLDADYLLISKSSFSFVAALLNRNQANIYFFPFWHSAPRSWRPIEE